MTKNKFYKEKDKNMHLAVIGAGVSGLTIAMHLSKKHKITLYEANNYLGGHALTSVSYTHLTLPTIYSV